jgi:hypothetical protein
MSAAEKIDKGDPAELLDLLWRCGLCGHQSWMATQPDRCNGCGTAQAPTMGPDHGGVAGLAPWPENRLGGFMRADRAYAVEEDATDPLLDAAAKISQRSARELLKR